MTTASYAGDDQMYEVPGSRLRELTDRIAELTAERDDYRDKWALADAEYQATRPVIAAAREMVQHPASREVLERLEDAVDALDGTDG